MIKLVLLTTAAVLVLAVSGPAFSKDVYSEWKTDPHGEKAVKSGGSFSPEGATGTCGPGYHLAHGNPGNSTCFWVNRGATLRCPNVCKRNGDGQPADPPDPGV